MTLTQLEFRTSSAGATQNERVLEHLQSHIGEWVPMPELARVMGGYAVHSRIADLRGMGFDITHKSVSADAHKRHSFYRLNP